VYRQHFLYTFIICRLKFAVYK